MPRSTATVSVVVNDSTSTTTAMSASPPIAAAPVGPQSKRTCSVTDADDRLAERLAVVHVDQRLAEVLEVVRPRRSAA